MIGAVIDPVALPVTRVQDGRSPSASRRPLPLPTVPPPRTGAAVYGLAAVDCRGRVANRTVFGALGWMAGMPLGISFTRGVLVVSTDPCGVFGMTRQGHLRLPAPVRQCCSLGSGDRVLLTAYPDRGVLLVHPPTVLDALLAEAHATLLVTAEVLAPGRTRKGAPRAPAAGTTRPARPLPDPRYHRRSPGHRRPRCARQYGPHAPVQLEHRQHSRPRRRRNEPRCEWPCP
jgi:hypothetical protein